MRKIIFILAMVAAFIVTVSAQAQEPFDPRDYQDKHVGEPTEILVLGTPHLSGAPDTFDPAVLEPLLARLADYKPDAILVEALPGRSIAQLWQYRETYSDAANTYGGRAMVLAALARQGVEMDMPDAEAEVRRTLEEWPAAPTPSARRRLAALLTASGDPASAMAQWWQLDAGERIADENVPQLLADQFATFDNPTRRNENYLIAARLAERLGLERLYPMDDQSDDAGPDFMQNFQIMANEVWFGELVADPRFIPLLEANQRLTSPEEALDTYRMLNGVITGRNDSDGQWLSLINRESPNNVGRTRVAAWETRNLRMAANIREVSSWTPGGRILVITGASHKPWLDAYLSMMTDVRLVDAQKVLE